MKKLAFVLLLAMPFTAASQGSSPGNWLIYFGNKKISSRWNWHHEVQYRNYNFIGDMEQLLLRTGIGFNITENNNNLLAGYGYIISNNIVAGTGEIFQVNEHRIFQQFITRQNITRISLQHRYRFEQRFIGDNFKMRLRYFLGINVPINNTTMTDKTFYLSGYNEIFLNPSGTIYDRNRLYGGIGYMAGNKLKVELGYMNQHFFPRGRNQLNMIVFYNF